MKKLMSIIALTLVLVLLISPLASAEGIKVGMAVREITNDYNRGIISSAQAVIEENGDEMIVTDAQADFQKHNENIESLINSDIDALIIQLGDPQQIQPLVEKATAKGIPVVTAGIGSYVPGTYTDVGADDALMTALAADALLSAINYKGNVYVVWVPGAPLLETRKRVFEAVCATYADVTLHEVPSEHNPAKTQTQIEELLIANPEEGSIAGIFTTYDSMMTGASEAIRRAGRGNEISIVGIDGDKVTFQMIFAEGSPFVATCVQDSRDIGKRCANTIYTALDGSIAVGDLPGKTYSQCYIATRHNGVAAAEMAWSESIWEDTGLDKVAIEATYEQNQELLVCYPILP
jgi:ribose transport system substrate-binding protein